jgi:plasmid stabilization system protein ParE
MGTMLERSRLAEDLLRTIGKLFGPLRGGLALAVVFVGALLAAATGVVGASVVAMGLISLPIMLRYRYSTELSAGIIAESAGKDIDEAYLWFYEQSPSSADKWFRGLCRAIFSLGKMPARCPVAPESRDIDREVRQLLYGKKRQMYRILYEIREGVGVGLALAARAQRRHVVDDHHPDLGAAGEVEVDDALALRRRA